MVRLDKNLCSKCGLSIAFTFAVHVVSILRRPILDQNIVCSVLLLKSVGFFYMTITVTYTSLYFSLNLCGKDIICQCVTTSICEQEHHS